MSKSLNVNISGGNSAIGSVSQGDKDVVQGSAVISRDVDRSFASAENAIRKLAQESDTNRKQIEAVLSQLTVLGHEAKGGGDIGKGKMVLEGLRENFSWAYPAVKDFVRNVWPMLMRAIGS